MSDTSIRTAPASAGPPSSTAITGTTPASVAPIKPQPLPRSVLYRAVKALASLRLTVVLFVLSLILVFFGTLAQMQAGIWTIVHEYFRSFFVWIPFQLIAEFGKRFFGVPESFTVSGAFPFPGGWLLGTLLLANLLAAHAIRFKVSWKRSGILMIHAGIILMMLGELVTGVFAVEGRMPITTGESANYVLNDRKIELAIIDPSDPENEKVTVIPASLLKRDAVITHPDLPFDVRVDRYMKNSALVKPSGTRENPATKGIGKESVAVEQDEVSGVSSEQSIDQAAAYVTFLDKKTGDDLGTYMVQVFLKTQPVRVGDNTYGVSLRYKHVYKPYTFHLVEFKHDKYVGTTTARNFSSLVRVVDPEQGVDREVLIYMNAPLRYRGETFYQSGVLERDSGTILQVVDNPGWLMPYISCAVVTLGMIVHFTLSLIAFQRKRAAA